MRAVRDDEVAAALAGISVPRTQVLAFAVSAAAAGLGGGVLAVVAADRVARLVRPGALAGLLSAVVIGGLGSLAGAVWGSLVVVFLGTFITDHVDALELSPAVAAAAARQPAAGDLRPAARSS